MSLIVFKTWFLLGVGVAVVGLAIFGFARLSKVPVEWERRRRFFSLIGSLWLGISFLLSSAMYFWPRYAMVLNLLSMLLALVAVFFFLRAMFVKRE